MPTSLAVIMLLGCIAVFVLLGIAIVLTKDVFERVDTVKEADRKLYEICKSVRSMNKLKLELEEEVFKYKLLRETKEERKHGNRILDNSNNTNFIHSNRDISNSSNDSSDTNNSNTYDREDSKNNKSNN